MASKLVLLLSIIPLIARTDALFFGSSAPESEFEMRDNILVLNDKTFDAALKKYKSLMVNFFPSNSVCNTCHFVNKEFSESAKILLEQKEDTIALAWVDTHNNEELGKRFNVKNYPTIRYFKRGEEDDSTHGHYVGDWHSHSIVAWLRKKNGQSAYRKLATLTDIEDFAQDNEAAVIGIFRDPEGKEAQAFLNASKKVLDDAVNFGLITTNEDMLKREFGDSDKQAKIYVMKKFDESVVVFPEDKPMDSVDEIVNFVYLRAFRYVQPFSTSAADIQRTFGHPDIHTTCTLFASKEMEGYKQIYDEFREAAKVIREEFPHRIIFADLDTGHKENDDWVQFFEIRDDEPPLVMITVLDGRKLRYKLKPPVLADGVTKGPITTEGVKKLVRDFFAERLSPDLDSYKDEL